MRHATILVAILAFVPVASVTAQVPVRPGARVRVTGRFCQPVYSNCAGGYPQHRVASFVAWKADTLVVQSNGDPRARPPTPVETAVRSIPPIESRVILRRAYSARPGTLPPR